MTDFGGKGSRRVFAARLLREAQTQASTSVVSLVPSIVAMPVGTLVSTDRLPAVSTAGAAKTLTPANFRTYILPDGDKGDITTSASGATWTIDNGVVSYAKIQNVAANSFLANVTGSPASAQEIATSRIPLFASAITGTPSGTTYLRGDGTWATVTGGSGDVVGPASATDNAVARFNLTTGKLIQNSSVTIADSGQVTITDSTFLQPQLLVRYDVGNYLEVTSTGTGTAFRSVTSAAGNGISFSTPGAGPNTISFSTDEIFGSAGTFVRFQTPTFRLIDASLGVNLDIGMNASGLVTYDITGGTPSHRFEDVVNINTTAGLQVLGTKVVGAQGATISDPTGGTVQDSEARTAINTIIDRLQAHGLIA